MIPYKSIKISQLNEFGKNTLSDHLQMKVTDLGEDYVTMSMPVSSQVHQPMGLLHGGAVAALAENVASLAGNLVVAHQNKSCLGLTLNTSHLKSVREGMVYATAKAIHLGRSTQVWEIKVTNDDGDLISSCKLTTITLPKK